MKLENRFSYFSLEVKEHIETICSSITDKMIVNDYLASIYHISSLILDLDDALEAFGESLEQRLFFSNKKNTPINEHLIILVWFTLSNELRETIVFESNYDVFWKMLINYTEYALITKEIVDYRYIFPVATPRAISRAIKMKCSSFHPVVDSDDTLYVITDSESSEIHTLPEAENPLILKSEIKFFKCLYSEHFKNAVEAKLNSSHAPDLDNINKKLDKLLGLEVQKPVIASRDFLTLKETAQFLGLTTKTMYDYNLKKILPYYSPNGKLKYYKRSDLEDYITAKKIKSAQEMEAEVKLFLD